MNLLLGADNQVAIRKNGLQMLRYAVRFDIALLARPMPREAPQIGPVVDIEDHLAAMLAGDRHRLALGRVGMRLGEMRPRHQHRRRRCDEALVDVVFVQRPIGAVVAVEDQWESLVVLDRQQDQRGEPCRIGDDAADVDPFAAICSLMKRPICSSPTRVISAGFQPQPRRADGDVRRAAAHRLGKSRHILEARRRSAGRRDRPSSAPR